MPELKMGDIVEVINANRPLFNNGKTYTRAIVCSDFPFILVSEDAEMRWNKREQHQFRVTGTASPDVLKKCINKLNRDYGISQVK